MNAALEFHDSKVSKVEADPGALLVFISAYVHRSEGTPGVDGGEGYIQPVQLRITSATWKGSLEESVGNIWDGGLFVDEKPVRLVPLPFEAGHPVRLELQFVNGAMLSVVGTSVQVRPTGEARFVERFSS